MTRVFINSNSKYGLLSREGRESKVNSMVRVAFKLHYPLQSPWTRPSPSSLPPSTLPPFQYQCLNSGPTHWATPPALFHEGFFEIGSCKLFALAGWLWTTILLISASWDQEPPMPGFFLSFFLFFFLLVLGFELRALPLARQVLYQPFLQPCTRLLTNTY
jgi:hypothetical protein